MLRARAQGIADGALFSGGLLAPIPGTGSALQEMIRQCAITARTERAALRVQRMWRLKAAQTLLRTLVQQAVAQDKARSSHCGHTSSKSKSSLVFMRSLAYTC